MRKLTTLLVFFFCLTAAATESPDKVAGQSTELPEPAAAATPTDTAKAIEVAVATPSPTESIKTVCRSHFSTPTQNAGANACLVGATAMQKDGATKAISSCKEKFPFSNRDELSCRIGVGMAQDLVRTPELDKNKLKTCQELYPVVTALDAYFQEACLAGAYSVAPNAKPDIKLCQAFSDDRAFVGPCVSGMSAAINSESKISVGEQNKACLQFFDKTQFHTGHRACLNSRALFVIAELNKTSVVQQCDLLTSNNKSETERAACVVGASIAKATSEGASLENRFKECGVGKVSYQGRDYLACLTAASLLHFMDKSKARLACKTVFSTGSVSKKRKSRRNRETAGGGASRAQCTSFIDKF